MKKLTFSILFLVCFLALHAQLSFGDPHKINQEWKFFAGNPENAESIAFDDRKWQKIDLPHDWSIKQPLSPSLASCMGYLPGGIGWYRKAIDIPLEKKNEKIYLYFEGVYNRSQVYLNGHLLGERPNGYISFSYDITPYVNFGGKNIITVKVDHSRSADSRWYTGSGIYRDVWLVFANPIHISQWGIFAYPEVKSSEKAYIHVETEVENGTDQNSNVTVEQELLSPGGIIIVKKTSKLQIEPRTKKKLVQLLNVKKPNLWSIHNPVLYTLNTRIYKDGKIVDQDVLSTGIRSYTFDPDKGIALNGEWIKIKGVCLHHDSGVLGAVSFKAVWRRRLQALKEIGVNAIRTSHNPQASHLYELCDEMGFLVMDEAFDEWKYPKRKWIEGWNTGTPGFEGSFDFFESWGKRDLSDIVRRDRNHISIFAWSIGNEVDYPNDPYSHPVLDGGADSGFTQAAFGGYKKDAPNAIELGTIAKSLSTVVKEYDLSRPVTAGLAGVAMSNATEYPGTLDIAGYNYTESRYDIDHQKYPNRIIFGSENRHELKAWKAVRDKEHIFGQFLWTGVDYLGESGAWPSRGFYSGLLDFGGFIKPRGRFRQALWADKPVVYIGTYPSPVAGHGSGMKDVWSQLQQSQNKNQKEIKPSMDAWPVWNYDSGESIRVVCYTNAVSVQLFVNEKAIGDRKKYDDDSGIIYWDVPYEEGKIEAVGYDSLGKEISRDLIRSSGTPYALFAKNENPVIDKDRGIAHIVVDVIDNNNTPVMLADNMVTCTIEGPGKLLGMEAGNNEDMTDYTDNVQRVFNGRILVYIQATGTSGTVKLKFSSPLLKPVDVTLDIR